MGSVSDRWGESSSPSGRGFLMRQLTRGAKIFNGVLALPLVGLGVLSMFFGAWQGALACFALALFLFWILPTLTGNLKASLHEKVTVGRDVPAALGSAVSERRTCPQCAEPIMRDALVCHFCGFQMGDILAREAEAREEQSRVLAAQNREREDLRARELEHRHAEREAWKSSHPRIGWVPVRNKVQAGLTAGVLVCLVAGGVLLAATLSTQAGAEEAMLRPLQGTWIGVEVIGAGASDETAVHSTLVIAGKSIHKVTTYEPQSDMWQNDDSVSQITRVETSTSGYLSVFTDREGNFSVWGLGTASAQIRGFSVMDVYTRK